jgi:hypothetical protein
VNIALHCLGFAGINIEIVWRLYICDGRLTQGCVRLPLPKEGSVE